MWRMPNRRFKEWAHTGGHVENRRADIAKRAGIFCSDLLNPQIGRHAGRISRCAVQLRHFPITFEPTRFEPLRYDSRLCLRAKRNAKAQVGRPIPVNDCIEQHFRHRLIEPQSDYAVEEQAPARIVLDVLDPETG